jgi:hypothetical protein
VVFRQQNLITEVEGHHRDTRARMFLFPSDEVGEATAIITITDTTADLAMAGIWGTHGGIGE